MSGEVSTFAKHKWIGRGKTYPDDPPPDLRAYHDSVFEMPLDIAKRLLPDRDMPIAQFLTHKLPPRSVSLVIHDTKRCFSMEEPTEDIQALHTRSIPSREFVKHAAQSYSQALLDGARSFKDPHYKGGSWPIWIIDFWTQMHDVIDAQNLWKKSDYWISARMDQTAKRPELDECRAYFHTLGWDSVVRLRNSGATTVLFAALLAERMINSAVLDLMLMDISYRLRLDPHMSARFEIATMSFMDEVHRIYDAKSTKTRQHLWELEEMLKTTQKGLLVPVYIQEHSHFLAILVDFEHETIQYGAC